MEVRSNRMSELHLTVSVLKSQQKSFRLLGSLSVSHNGFRNSGKLDSVSALGHDKYCDDILLVLNFMKHHVS